MENENKDVLPPVQILDLAQRCGVKATEAALVEFAALVRAAEPLAPEEMRPAQVAPPAGPVDGDVRGALQHIHDTFKRDLDAGYKTLDKEFAVEVAAEALGVPVGSAPIQMILHCPKCHAQHIDAPDERTASWTNPPHRSHLCHTCGNIWRPADVATEGVRATQTKGSKDSEPAVGSALVAMPRELAQRVYDRLCKAQIFPLAAEVRKAMDAAPTGALVASIDQSDTQAYWPLGMPSRSAPLPDGWLDDYITNCAKLNKGEMLGVYFVEGVRFAENHFGIGSRAAPTESAAAPADTLEQMLMERRIGLIPENEGGWHATVYGDGEEPAWRGYADTPSGAIKSALATHQPSTQAEGK